MPRDLLASQPRDLLAGQAQQPAGIQQDPRLQEIPQSPGGRVGDAVRQAQERRLGETLEFEQLPQETQDLINSVSPAEAFLIGTGRGLENLGRGVGLVGPDPGSDRAVENLRLRNPISTGAGEIAGEVAPFLPAGVSVGAIKSTAPRVLASTALGASEGGIITRGRGGDRGESLATAGVTGLAAGALEVGVPFIGRLAGTFVRRSTGRSPKGSLVTPEGTPTPELAQALDAEGITFDNLVEKAREGLNTPNVDPEQAAREALFRDLDAPTLRGDITQEFQDQAIDQRFVGQTDPVSDPVRQVRLEQSQAFTTRLNEQIEAAGLPDDVGKSIKDALTSRRDILRKEKNDLYKKAAEQAEEVGEIPVFTDDIVEAIPDARTKRRISRLQGSQVDALDDLLVEFGVLKDPDLVEAFTKSGGVVEPLSIKNVEEFRAAINQIERADSTNAINVLTSPIKKALDTEADNALQAMQLQGLSGEALETFKRARDTTTQLKTEFSPQSVTGRLTDVKRDGLTPVIEASDVYKELINKKPEFLTRTLSSLRNSGVKGTKAIGDLQAAVVLDLVENAFKAETRKIQGVKTFGAVAFNKRLQQIGDDRLKEIFKNNPKTLGEIKKVSRAAELTTPDNRAVPKGSGDIILDRVVPILERIPGAKLPAGGLRILAKNSRNEADLAKAINSKPEVKRIATFIDNDFPSLAAALGIPVALKAAEDE